jgi:signal transduction histidine kinase
MIRSLRVRLLVQTSIAAALLMGLLGFALYFGLRHSVKSSFDRALRTEADSLAATAEQHGDTILFDYAPAEMPQFVTRDHPDYYEAWIDSDTVLRSPSLGNGDLSRSGGSSGGTFVDVTLPNGKRGRMITLSFETTIESNAHGDSASSDQPHTIVLAVAGEAHAVNESLENFGWILVVWCCVAIVVCGVVLLVIVGRAVRPVERMARDIDELGENDLSGRLSAPDAPSELQPVIDKLNGLLGRLESAFAREKAFTADVAHELRTPLSALLTTFEVCRSRPRDEAAYVSAIDKCREDMVETILVLTRADSGQLSLKPKKVDAADLLEDSWAFFAEGAQERNLSIEWQVSGPIFIETDAEKMMMIFQNLFDNAVSYANQSGKLRIEARLGEGRLMIEVANTGSRVPREKTGQLFQRFWRGDEARADTGSHCGLGLSLCQRLARFLKGQIEIEIRDPDWFVVRLTLPASATTGQAAISSPPAPPGPSVQAPGRLAHSSAE